MARTVQLLKALHPPQIEHIVMLMLGALHGLLATSMGFGSDMRAYTDRAMYEHILMMTLGSVVASAIDVYQSTCLAHGVWARLMHVVTIAECWNAASCAYLNLAKTYASWTCLLWVSFERYATLASDPQAFIFTISRGVNNVKRTPPRQTSLHPE